jgi:hypothetical protein
VKLACKNVCGVIFAVWVPILNEDISDLEQRLADHVPKDLRYSCHFWAEHLHRSAIDDELYSLVREFIFQNMLHWFEAMSLMGSHDASSAMLTLARALLKVTFFLFTVFVPLTSISPGTTRH